MLDMQRLDSSNSNFSDKFAEIKHNKRSLANPEVGEAVSKIIEQLRDGGNNSLLELTNRYDGSEYKTLEELTFNKDDFFTAHQSLAPEMAKYLLEINQRISDYHSRQVQHSWFEQLSASNMWGQKIVPLNRVGVYAPGGKAAYPSSVLMGCIPARIAEVPQVIVTSPRVTADSASGQLTLAAAHIGGADKLYAVGGAQAVAAMALGSTDIPKVDKIVGPGNSYVTEAKRQLVGEVGIDSLAGPSELVIVADKSAPPAWIAADMLAQAEHAADTKVLLFAADAELLDKVEMEIDKQLPMQQRQDIIAKSLNDFAVLLKIKDIQEAVQLADSLAPEHLQLMVENPMGHKDMIKQSAAVFCGIHTSTVYGDYGAGPNHILPTGDAARFSSPLGVSDFTKRISFLSMDDKIAQKLTPATAEIAMAEGLPAHANAAKIRVNQAVDGSDGSDKEHDDDGKNARENPSAKDGED